MGSSALALVAEKTPAETVLELSRIDSDHRQAGDPSDEDKDKALLKGFSKSFNQDLNRVFAYQGNWWDADLLSGHQGTDGMEITSIESTRIKGDKAVVTALFHEKAGDEYYPTEKVSFDLVKEDGAWKVDEIATASATEEGSDAMHAHFRRVQQGFLRYGSKQRFEPDWIIQKFDNDNAKCRTYAEIGESCNDKDKIAKLLEAHKYCYGKKGEKPYDMHWEPCTADSYGK